MDKETFRLQYLLDEVANLYDPALGGDLITAIDGAAIKTMEDLIAYLADQTKVGQKVTLEARPAQTETAQDTPAANSASGTKPGQEVKLNILRNGQEQTLAVTLAEHP